MKLITANLLNRLWVKGINPVIERVSALEKKTTGLTNSLENALDGLNIRHYNSNGTTLTALMRGLTAPCMCLTTTEYISDKPANKYGTIMIVKLSENRAFATCACTDGTYWINAWNSSTSTLTGWQEK